MNGFSVRLSNNPQPPLTRRDPVPVSDTTVALRLFASRLKERTTHFTKIDTTPIGTGHYLQSEVAGSPERRRREPIELLNHVVV